MFLNSRIYCYLFIFLFITIHLSYIQTPFCNLEWVYRFATQYFIKEDAKYLETYFHNQANPLTYSFITSQLINFFKLDEIIIYRIPSLFGSILLLLSLTIYRNVPENIKKFKNN